MQGLNELVKIEVSSSKVNLIYQILGHFGDRLDNDVKQELHSMVNDEVNESSKVKQKLINKLK